MKHHGLVIILAKMARKFPPVNSGGLIEAQLDPFDFFLFLPAFPPVNSGGLIEATRLSACSKTTAASFRR